MNTNRKSILYSAIFLSFIFILNCSQADVYTNATKEADLSKQLLEIQLVVNAEPIENIYSIPAGYRIYLQAVGSFNDLTTEDVSAEVEWVYSDPGIVTIVSDVNTENGETSYFARGLVPGTADVTASLDGIVSQTITIKVTDALLLAVIVQPYSAVFPEVPTGWTQQFTAYGYYSDAVARSLTTGVTWNSSNTGVATISSTGLATTNSRGSTTISAEYDGISSEDIFQDATHSAMLTVALLSSIVITPATSSATWTKPLGFNQQFTATGHYVGYSGTHEITNQVAWASNNAAVATITTAGYATSVSFGTSLITAGYGITPPAGVQFIVDNKIYVSAARGDNNADGTIANNAPTPLATIEKALSIAAAYRGMEIHVAAGTYPEYVLLSAGTSLYGGHASDFSSPARDPKSNITTIDNPGSAVTPLYPAPTIYISSGDSEYTTIIDGFTINTGNGVTSERCGVRINTDSVASYNTIISNNNVSGNTSGTYTYSRTYAVYINDTNNDSNANTYNILLDSNQLFGGIIPPMPISNETYALYASKSTSSAESIKINLWNNTINGGSATTATGPTFNAGTYCVYADNVEMNIYNNTMFIGRAMSTNIANEYGIYLLNNMDTNIINNIIFGDGLTALPNGYEYGIYEGDGTDPNIVNNNCVYNMNTALYHDYDNLTFNSGNLNQVSILPEGKFYYFDGGINHYMINPPDALTNLYNVSEDPFFADTYWRLGIGSPASVRLGGTDLTGVVVWTDGPKLQHDKDGNSRTIINPGPPPLGWSIGAYEQD